MDMNTYGQTENRIGNMEFGERVLRGGVGMIMMETVFLATALTPALIAGLTFAALYLVLTAIMAWDPIYALAQLSLQGKGGEVVKASVTPLPSRPETRVSHGHKKAA
jgi:hypothetical protein